MDQSTPRVSAAGISKRYGGVQALDNVSIRVQPGEILCLAGENGSGKSTFSKCLAGTEIPDAGQFFIDGQPIGALDQKGRMRAGIQMIYQDFSLFENLSAAENIYLVKQSCAGHRVLERRKGRAEAVETLRSIGVDIDPDQLVQTLAVGEKQSVAIARAISQDARIIIMDEPTTALTDPEIEKLMQIIKRLAAQGLSFIFISHKLEEILDLTDRTVVLRGGKLVLEAATSELTEADITRAMIGRDLPEPEPRQACAAQAGPLLELEGLSRGGAFGPVDLKLQPGEVLGLGGRLGCGRTALALALFGALPATDGRIRLSGQEKRIGSIPQALSLGIAYVPEDRLTEGLFLGRSIAENQTLVVQPRNTGAFGFLRFGRLQALAQDWKERLNIATPDITLPVRSLSGGNQQRVLLAKWLMDEPRLLILNRPSVGVDVGSKFALHKVIRAVADQGVGVIVISDDLTELDALSDRRLLVQDGRILREVDSFVTNRVAS